MRRFMYFVMVAVLVLMMAVPMRAEAADYIEGDDMGPPGVKSSSGSYSSGSEWDYIGYSNNPNTDGQYVSAYKDYIQYITIDAAKYWASSGYLGYYMFIAPIDLSFSADLYLYASQTASVSVVDVELLGQYSGVTFTQSVMSSSITAVGSGTYSLDASLGQIRVSTTERNLVGVDGAAMVTLKVVYRLHVGAGSVDGLAVAPNVTLGASVASWGKTFFYKERIEKTWFDNLNSVVSSWGSNIVSSVTTLQTNIGNWFSTQWSKMQSWTDSIIEAITGSGGGEQIDDAQSELDDQLNSFEEAENNLSDAVIDKVEVPSLSLSSDESSGLSWVISTMNSFYTSFDELHIMFASVLFFAIVAVLLFGRRSL